LCQVNRVRFRDEPGRRALLDGSDFGRLILNSGLKGGLKRVNLLCFRLSIGSEQVVALQGELFGAEELGLGSRIAGDVGLDRCIKNVFLLLLLSCFLVCQPRFSCFGNAPGFVDVAHLD
jgi:hypothetical protein